MAVQRFNYRHVQQTIADFIQAELTTLGWVTPPTINFGTTPVTFVEVQPDDETDVLVPNVVSTTMGDEPADELEELGGGLWSISYAVFFDVYGETPAMSLNICHDIKQSVRDRIIPVYNYNGSPRSLVSGQTIEFEDVIGPERPERTIGESGLRRNWRVVKATARSYYQD